MTRNFSDDYADNDRLAERSVAADSKMLLENNSYYHSQSIHDSAASSEAESSLEDEKDKDGHLYCRIFRFKYMLCRYKRIGNRSNERQFI